MPETRTLHERLRAHPVLAKIPEGEIEWIAANGTLRAMRKGEVFASASTGVPTEMLIILTGRIVIWADRVRRVTDWNAGEITGRFPFSRMTHSVREARVEEEGEMLAVHMDHFPAMVRECPELTEHVVHLMLDRTRLFTRHDLHDEKIASLGRLAAGLAHELDNPASALVRNAKLLESALREADAAARSLGSRELNADRMALIERFRDDCLASAERPPPSPLERARQQETLYDWIERRGLDTGIADFLTDVSVTPEQLDTLADRIGPELLEPAIRWIATTSNGIALATDLGQTATRISDLVGAVKGFTDMDAAMAPRIVDLRKGILETVEMLRARAREKNVTISVSIDTDLPPIEAVRGELNQVWLKLLDNALDASPRGGVIRVEAAAHNDQVIVSVVDNGPGIPAEIRDRIFDPFFTTKPVGAGTGLGLDIARRLVANHAGTIQFACEPGRTVFEVALSTAGAADPYPPNPGGDSPAISGSPRRRSDGRT